MIENDRKYIIKSSRLEGEVRISGAKNSALRLLAASILTNEKITIENFPTGILDGKIHLGMLEKLGKTALIEDTTVTMTEDGSLDSQLNWSGPSIRNTLLILGALLTRFGYGSVPLPGGCKIGSRKYDLHEMVFKKMGAHVWTKDNFLFAESGQRLTGAEIVLPIRSTGATENAVICACLAEGKTRIWNPHVRPEILDLILFLNNMGADITVHGQEHIEVTGVEQLHGAAHRVIPDNVEALTWITAAIITRGYVEIIDVPFSHIDIPMIFLQESDTQFYRSGNNLIVKGGKSYPFEISTGPYPGINSDMQPIFVSYALMANGLSRIIDSRFPDRHAYLNELSKMNASIASKGNVITINGGNELFGAEVTATDIRGGAALTLSGLAANGETIISNTHQIERGYNEFFDKLLSMKANIAVSA